MKLTQHVIDQIAHAQENSIDLTQCTLEAFEGDEERPYLVNNASGHDPVPPGTPPPVPPVH